MTFSGTVKDELSKENNSRRHCQLAEIAAMFSLCGRVHINQGETDVYFITENLAVARKYANLVKRVFHILPGVIVRRHEHLKKSRVYVLYIQNTKDCSRFLGAIKMLDGQQIMPALDRPVSSLLLQNGCCRRAFIRGSFLAAGSVNAPEKSYHFEIVFPALEKAEQMKRLIHTFEIDAKVITRKKHFVVYIKDGNQISLMLNVMEAPVSLMQFENVRIVKEMRNSINRKVNCEAANINKTVSAAFKQIEDIHYIEKHMGFGKLPDALQQVAEVRLEHPDGTLKELGGMLSPPVGKSGVNHRLRKLSELADELRENMPTTD